MARRYTLTFDLRQAQAARALGLSVVTA